MARKVIGPTGSRRRRWLFLCTSAVAIAMAVIFIPSAFAVHDLAFQLDGETTSTAYSPPPGSSPAYDWNDIFNVSDSATTETVSNNSANVGSGKTFDDAQFARDFETNSTCPTTSAVGLNSTSTTLCTGDDTTYATGSKDTLGIGNGGWQCNHDNNVNSKIDIMNAYVTQYTNPADGHKIFYFGVERNVSNGTNDVGVWFLQSGASCTAPTGHVNFTGQHQDGDTLVVAEQTSGGGVSTAKAFRWAAAASGPLSGDGGCIDSNDNPDPSIVVNGTHGCNNLPIATGADCKNAPGVDPLCATTNATCPLPRRGTTVPPCTLDWNKSVTTKWLTANGSSVGNTIVSPDFFEGGIDITAAFEGHAGTTPSCFNTVAPDTRSSASPTATLFDYTLNQLGGCGGELTTQQNFGSSSQAIGTDGTISSGTDSATLTITGSASWGGTLTWYLCGPDVTSCDTHGVQVASETVSNTDGGSSADTPKAYSTSDLGVTGSSAASLTSAAGSGQYCWHAQFVPNTASKNAGIGNEDDDGSGECFTVTPVTPTLTTTASCSASPCVLGSTLSDTASLTGTANNPNGDGAGGDTGLYKSINGTTTPATGSISWTAYGPDGCGTVAMSATSRDVSGDGTYPTALQTAVSFVPSAVGAYVFVATYGGSGPNTNAPSTTATCASPGSNESVTVTGSASSSTAQRWLPNDRVALSSTTGTTLHGTLTVTLYKGAFGGSAGNCTIGTGVPVTGQAYGPITVNNGTNSFIYNTTNTTFVVGTNSDGTTTGAGTDGTYFWLIHYADTGGLTSPHDRCETSTISHNDG